MAKARRREERFIERLAGAAKKESPLRLVMQLAWTAGPVTYLALQGGYLLGYQQPAPTNLLLYFASYTVITGVIAAVSRIIYKATRGHAVEKARHDLLAALDVLPDLIVRTRNLGLAYYGADARRILAAGYVLENPDASPEGVRIAVADLTDDPVLADLAARIELFRRSGLMGRARDLIDGLSHGARPHVERLTPIAPVTAALLENRLAGIVPEKRKGRTRSEGFLPRALSAVESGELALLSLRDVEEVVTLAIEIIAGRTFDLIRVHYHGDRRFSEVAEELQQARRAYRRAFRTLAGRIRVMAETLYATKAVKSIAAASPRLTDVALLWRNVQAGLKEVAASLQKQVDKPNDRERRQREFRDLGRRFLRARTLYRAVTRAVDHSERAIKRVDDVRKRYFAVRAQLGRGQELRVVTRLPPSGVVAVRLETEALVVSEESRLKIAARVRELAETTEIVERGLAQDVAFAEAEEVVKGFAVEVVAILDEFLPLHRLPVQVAVEASRAAFVGALETGLTAQTKAGWLAALVASVEPDWEPTLIRLLQALVDDHGLSIDPSGAEALAEQFAARPEKITAIEPAGQAKEVERERRIEAPPWPREYEDLAAKVEKSIRKSG